MGIDISKINKFILIAIFFLFCLVFFNKNTVNAATSCDDVPPCTYQPQSYCLCTDYCETEWDEDEQAYVKVEPCTFICGCTQLNNGFICDGLWGASTCSR